MSPLQHVRLSLQLFHSDYCDYNLLEILNDSRYTIAYIVPVDKVEPVPDTWRQQYKYDFKSFGSSNL